MERTKKELISLFAYFIAVLLFYTTNLGGIYHGKILNILSASFNIAPIYFGFIALKYFGAKNTQGKSVLFISSALVMWLVADMVWILFTENSVVSIADFFYLIGYPAFALGIIFGVNTLYPDFFRAKKNILSIGIISLVVIAVYLKFFPFLWSADTPAIENFATVGYVLADLVLIVLILLIIYLVFSGFYSNFWIIVGASLILNFTGDLFYALNAENYESGSLVDLWWFFSRILLSVGFIVLVKNAESVTKKIGLKTDSSGDFKKPAKMPRNKPWIGSFFF